MMFGEEKTKRSVYHVVKKFDDKFDRFERMAEIGHSIHRHIVTVCLLCPETQTTLLLTPKFALSSPLWKQSVTELTTRRMVSIRSRILFAVI